MSIKILRRIFSITAGTLPALLLIMFYSVGTFEFDVIHQIIHPDHHSTLHSAEDENDACHIAIYHSDQEKGCTHESHVTADESCPLDQIVCHASHVLPEIDFSYALNFYVNYAPKESSFVAVKLIDLNASRAPPVS